MAYNKGATFVTSRYQVDGETLDIQEALNETIGDVLERVKGVGSLQDLLNKKGDYEGEAVALKSGGRTGVFQWVDEDVSAEVSTDPLMGVYVPPESSPTGNQGAWIRMYSGAINPLWFGAVGDGVSDDTDAFQACVNFTQGNGGIEITTHFLTSQPILSAGILSLTSPQVPSLYAKASDGVVRPYRITNTTTDMFDTDVDNSQSAFHFSGITFVGSSDTTLFSTAGKSQIVDYFNVDLSGCQTEGFFTAVDGSLGSWLWRIENCNFGGGVGYHDTAIILYQPHGAVIEKNGFGYANRRDIYSTGGGVATSLRDNAIDFKLDKKEICVEIDNPQSWLIEGNYSEQYSGTPLVNGGDGTYPYVIRLSHYNDNYIPVIRNNYFAASSVQRLITLGRSKGDENFYSNLGIEIYENTVNGLAGDYIYHNHDAEFAGRTLTIPRPRIDVGDTEYSIGDPNDTLRFVGNGAKTVVRSVLSSPANNTVIKPLESYSEIFQDDKILTMQSDGVYRLNTGYPYKVNISWRWDSATEADFKFRVYDSSGAPNLGSMDARQQGTYGAGSLFIPVERGNLTYLYIKVENTSGSAAVCDNLTVHVDIESLSL